MLAHRDTRSQPATSSSAALLSRRTLRRVARWLIGLLLLTQLAVTAHACPAIAAWADAPTGAFAASAGDDFLGTSAGPAEQNLCGEHCKAGQQSDHAPSVVVPALLRTLAYRVATPAETAPPPRAPAAVASALAAAAPPHAIVHCVFRI